MLCAVLNIPHAPTSFNSVIGSVVADVSVSFMMQKAREAIAENAEDGRVHTTASFDGPWQKLGHISLNCIISATFVNRGKVLDTEIMSKSCFVCPINPTSQHQCKKTMKEQVVEWNVHVYSTFLIVLFAPEACVTQSILVMGTANHTIGWLQGSCMIPT
jgi:hypothetical protein